MVFTIDLHAGGFNPNKQYISSSYVTPTIQRILIYNRLGNSVPIHSVGKCENKIIYMINSIQALSEFLKKEEVLCNIASRKSYKDHFEIRFPYIGSCSDIIDSFYLLQKTRNFDHLSYGRAFAHTVVNRTSSWGVEVFDFKNFNEVERYWEHIRNIEIIDYKIEKNKLGSNCLLTGVAR